MNGLRCQAGWCLLSLVGLFNGLAAFAGEPNARGDEPSPRLFVGTYTGGESEGIYTCRLQLNSGELTELKLAARAVNPSFLALHPNRKFLYAVGEVGDFNGAKTGGVSAFALDAGSGELTLLNQQSSAGSGPCYVVVAPDGKNVLVANYSAGSVAVLPLEPDGRLKAAQSMQQHKGHGFNPQRQSEPHAHSIQVAPGGRFALSADLGLDQVLVYAFDADRGLLRPSEPPFYSTAPGAGPRHFAFHPTGEFLYVVNELNSTVSAWTFDARTGRLAPIQTIGTLPEDYRGNNSTAEIQVHLSGQFVYASNRGHDSIAAFSVDGKTGHLTSLGQTSTGGKTPRNFAIDPTGAWLLAENQDSGSIVTLRIDQPTGRLVETGRSLKAPRPVCIKFLPRTVE